MLARFLRCFENPAALLALVVAALLSIGLVTVYSASGARAGLESLRVEARNADRPDEEYRFHHGANYLVKQVTWGLLGLAVAIGLLKIPLEFYEKYALHIFIFSLFVLVLVIATPLGVEAKGARRWLRVGPFTVQPSEFAKIALVIFMAKFLAAKREKMKDFIHGLLPGIGIMGAFSLLIILERDLGTIILMSSVVLAMWCLAQVRFQHLGMIVLCVMPIFAALIFKESYRIHRVLAFLDPEKYALTIGYQLNQSLIAVGSGGIFGTGIGQGLQKYHFLSESHTDFIFAIVCEEFGLIGATSVCLLFAAFILIGCRISYEAQDYFSGLLAAGLTLIIGFAAFINFFVVLGMAPTKGLALPFFSYGGSSIMASLICVGLLISISNGSLSLRGSREVV